MSELGSCRSRPRLVIVGYGNEWRADDGAGPAVVRELETRPLRPEVSLVVCRQLLPEISAELANADRVYFVDADASGLAGQIRVRRLSRTRKAAVEEHASFAPAPVSELLGHRWAPQTVLQLVREVYGRSLTARIYTIGVERLDHDATLSASVRQAVERLVDCWSRRFSRAPAPFPVDDQSVAFENSSTI